MNILNSPKFELAFTERGAVKSLRMKDDPYAMNWVVDPGYLAEAGYDDVDKLFGEWTAVVNGRTIRSLDLIPAIRKVSEHCAEVSFDTEGLTITLTYRLEEERMIWQIESFNSTDKELRVDGFHLWFSLAYVMFRDDNVVRNIRQSCAVFAHMGGDFSKFAAIRRSNEAPHLGIYGKKGRSAAFGSFCRYENRFLEQVSPSLDGLLFHRLSLVENGSSMPESAAVDWIYGDEYDPLILDAGQRVQWEYAFAACDDQEDFYQQALEHGHPRWTYTPVLTSGGVFQAELELPNGQQVRQVRLLTSPSSQGVVQEEDITSFFAADGQCPQRFQAALQRTEPGEHKLELLLEDGRKDILVWNVLEPIDRILEKRAEWLCRNNYDAEGTMGRAHAFLPLSNQGESLGKLTFLLMKNSLTTPVQEQVEKAEASAVLDMKRHWFEHGNFTKPRALYGSFYRIFDLDYIAHVFYLLSRMEASLLKLNTPHTYLEWAAEVLAVRLNPDCHQGQREKDETGLSGVFILYIDDLLKDLWETGMLVWHQRLTRLWQEFGVRLERNEEPFAGAITEHFYDNAGFGPTCETLLSVGLRDEAEKYGQLILANIGFSNDYRAQNPDRWWEALSYMIHSLWGGLVAASSRVAYEHLGNPQYLEAAYRAAMAVFNCYDWNVISTPRRLQPGEAASTYSVAAPNLNMPSLSRDRFGQSVFRNASDPLFASLFANATGDDWDMGEELVAYLLGFGTTTYLYRDAKGQLRCVNGYITEDGDSWIITSYAAYPMRYVVQEEGLVLEASKGEVLRQARFWDGKLTALEAVRKGER
ncbi:hypothetical protein [Paenibacillus woosongensis]|uniref:Six-hairpin glycosidase-like protein n=1 Tax=Paenibacillus woosongensis TaxID=307580 RepID=A0ABQ4MXX7_9BACL|nr:hypothetical protein [Paenibacillus woosongensis]GIP60725.1 hypothetical protein J15TS10_45390 [Paenibacillus woosongensis]